MWSKNDTIDKYRIGKLGERIFSSNHFVISSFSSSAAAKKCEEKNPFMFKSERFADEFFPQNRHIVIGFNGKPIENQCINAHFFNIRLTRFFRETANKSRSTCVGKMVSQILQNGLCPT